MINGRTVQDIKEEAMDNSHIDEQIKDQEFANQIHIAENAALKARVAELEADKIVWKTLAEQRYEKWDHLRIALNEIPIIFNSDARHKASKMVEVAKKALGVK